MRTKKRIILVVVFILLLALLWGGLYYLFSSDDSAEEPLTADVPVPDYSEAVSIEKLPPQPTLEKEPSSEVTPAEPYVSPIDFQLLAEKNPDIYAWLHIPGADISFPILQNEKDNYYLTHNSEGKKANYGAIYTEKTYNSTDFLDPLTVLYGHRIKTGAMFGSLQPTYSEADALEKYSEIIVYLPDREIHYRVFAALPYDKRHILYTYDQHSPFDVQLFLNSMVNKKSVSAALARDEFPENGERLLVLSTCLYGDKYRRYLVVGKEIPGSPANAG